jgi:hypothetical protein
MRSVVVIVAIVVFVLIIFVRFVLAHRPKEEWRSRSETRSRSVQQLERRALTLTADEGFSAGVNSAWPSWVL